MPHERTRLTLLILAGVVVGGALGSWTNVGTLAVAGAALVGCCTVEQARKSIECSVLVAIGAALNIAKHLDSSGASALASRFISAVAGANPTGALVAICVATRSPTELLTDNAAAHSPSQWRMPLPSAWASRRCPWRPSSASPPHVSS